jgi:DNA-binding transcriptional MerR regulator/effector-binding domain-containing protein
MYSIGEFSKITGLTVKTLRFYHEQGVLRPSCVDDHTGYRYYDAHKVEAARAITRLRELEFTLAEIAEILGDFTDDAELVDFLERQQTAIAAKIAHLKNVKVSLAEIITKEREAQTMSRNPSFAVEEKTVPSQLIAGVRMKGRYCECGQGFAKIGRRFGWRICGRAFLLHYDCEYKENDADFEACMPIRKGASGDGISVRELPGGRCVTLIHQGPYEELGRAYEKVLDYIKQRGYEIQSPSREIYLKGPGMIFKGNPRKYLTEIQMMIAE